MTKIPETACPICNKNYDATEYAEFVCEAHSDWRVMMCDKCGSSVFTDNIDRCYLCNGKGRRKVATTVDSVQSTGFMRLKYQKVDNSILINRKVGKWRYQIEEVMKLKIDDGALRISGWFDKSEAERLSEVIRDHGKKLDTVSKGWRFERKIQVEDEGVVLYVGKPSVKAS